MTTDESSDSSEEDDDSFHYPSSSSARRASIASSDYFSQPYSHSPSRRRDLLTNDLSLSQAPEFRVPTHDAPQEATTPRWRPPGPHELGSEAKWEKDEDVVECRGCRRRFTFLFRKVLFFLSLKRYCGSLTSYLACKCSLQD
jgi:hypothetical protein